MSDGPERFNSCCTYMKEHGVFPQPIMLLSTPNGYDVLDGNHRLAAFFYLYGYFNIENAEIPCLKVANEQEVWIAKN